MPPARRLLLCGFVLSGLETFVAFMIVLGVLLRPLAIDTDVGDLHDSGAR